MTKQGSFLCSGPSLPGRLSSSVIKYSDALVLRQSKQLELHYLTNGDPTIQYAGLTPPSRRFLLGFCPAEVIGRFACYAKPLGRKVIIIRGKLTLSQQLLIQSDNEHIQAKHRKARTAHHILPPPYSDVKKYPREYHLFLW